MTELAFEIEPGMTASKVKVGLTAPVILRRHLIPGPTQAIVDNINQVWMAEIARDYGLVKALRAPKHTKDLLSRKAVVCVSLLRAYIARLHTDGELDAVVHPDAEGRHRRTTRKFVRQLFKPIINIERERLRNLEERDASPELPMSRLTQWVQENGKGLHATYRAEGIAPSQTFCCHLKLDEHVVEGLGGSKKEARRA